MANFMLIVKVVADNGGRVLFERDLTSPDLSNFPFSSVIDSLNVLYPNIPHSVEFKLVSI